MATLTRKTIAGAGTAFALTAAEETGDKVAYATGAKLLVKNDSLSSITVTVASEVADSLGITGADNVVTVAAGALAVIPLSTVYNKSADGLVAWTYSAFADVGVAVI